MKTISLLNLKGGVAKSFTAVNMAYELWCRGKAVLLWDNDKQGNLSKAFGRYDADQTAPASRILNGGWQDPKEVIQKTEYEGIDIITANMSLSNASWNLIREEERDMTERYRRFMKAVIKSQTEDGVGKRYDFCIIDNPPDILNPSLTLKGVLVTIYQNTDGEAAGLEWLEREWDDVKSRHYRQYKLLGRIRYSAKVAENSFVKSIKNLERGHKEYKKVRYLYKDMTPAMLELSLLMGNAYNRELTAWEKTQQAQRLKEALIRARDEDRLEIRGKLRDVVADLMNESSSGIARMDSIHKNAAPEIKEAFKNGSLSISAAYEAAKLPKEEQQEIARKATAKGSVQAKEIAERTAKKKEKAKDRPFSVVSKMDTGSETQADHKNIQKIESAGTTEEEKDRQAKKNDKIRPFKKADRHTEILREWRAENIDLAVVTKSVTDAIQKVSNVDIAKNEWTDTEWAVFIARVIMSRADCVSEEDLYLLHDIMIRCQEENF